MGGVDEGICGRGGGGDSPLSPLQQGKACIIVSSTAIFAFNSPQKINLVSQFKNNANERRREEHVFLEYQSRLIRCYEENENTIDLVDQRSILVMKRTPSYLKTCLSQGFICFTIIIKFTFTASTNFCLSNLHQGYLLATRSVVTCLSGEQCVQYDYHHQEKNCLILDSFYQQNLTYLSSVQLFGTPLMHYSHKFFQHCSLQIKLDRLTFLVYHPDRYSISPN